MKINNIVLQPVITEKTTKMSQAKTYSFQVSVKANKDQVRKTVEKLYSVEVASVRINIRKGKEKRVGKRMITKKLPDTKIAFVTVKKGNIDLFPQS